jgi:sulfur carrier protein
VDGLGNPSYGFQELPFVQITFNGQTREIDDRATIAALLVELNLTPKHVAVEVNREVVPRSQHAEHALAAGDEVEVVTLVGGG